MQAQTAERAVTQSPAAQTAVTVAFLQTSIKKMKMLLWLSFTTNIERHDAIGVKQKAASLATGMVNFANREGARARATAKAAACPNFMAKAVVARAKVRVVAIPRALMGSH